MTDAGVAALAAGNPDLEVLRLDGCSRVTEVGLAAVAESCRRLRVRDVPQCRVVPLHFAPDTELYGMEDGRCRALFGPACRSAAGPVEPVLLSLAS